MTRRFIPRRLRQRRPDGDIVFSDAEVLDLDGPVVVLGEAGMGKTELLKHLAQRPGSAFSRARRFVRGPGSSPCGNPEAQRWVIDALDEVPAARDGSAVDEVLRGLAQLGHPPFILSCRAADWRGSIAAPEIEDEYGQAPVELSLEPFDRRDAEEFLRHRFTLEEAQRLIEHFSTLGPEDLLGNPQTLTMIEAVGAQGALPTTRAALYDLAAAELRKERSSRKRVEPLAELDETTALDAAGAAFAAILLSGREAVSRAPSGSEGESDVHLSGVRRLPGGAPVDAVLGSRLFRAAGDDRFAPLHRTIAEHLAARWLSKTASTPRLRRRLLSLVRPDGIVPASLRGLHAWLARSPELAAEAIEADPLGVVLYGDPDRLSEEQARLLLRSLKAVDRWNRGFLTSGLPPSMDGLFHPRLVPEIRAAIRDRQEGMGLRHLILGAVRDRTVAETLREDLVIPMLDPKEGFPIRRDAVEALVRSGVEGLDWNGVAARLHGLGGSDDHRLTIDLMRIVGTAAFSDEEIVRYVLASARDTSEERVGGTLHVLAMFIPADRAARVLERLDAEELPDGDRDDGVFDLLRFIEQLVEAWLEQGDLDPLVLWRWVSLIATRVSDVRSGRGKLSDFLRANDDARRRIQRHMLLDAQDDKRDLWWRAHEMDQACPALHPSENDVVDLIRVAGPPPEDEVGLRHWVDRLGLADHTNGRGARVRAVAREVGRDHPAIAAAIHELENPQPPEWKKREDEREAKAAAERERRRAKWRAAFDEQLDDLCAGGAVGLLVTLAQAYLGHFHDLRDEDGPQERLADWMGPVIASAALEGFEAFLVGSACPSWAEIRRLRAENKMRPSEWVVVAALVARRLRGASLADLADDRLLVGAMARRSSPVADDEERASLDALIENEIRRRPGLMERHLRAVFEPGFARSEPQSYDLHAVMRSEADADVATALAEEWLDRFGAIDGAVEWILIDRLVESGRIDRLLELAQARRGRGWRSDDERRRWTAVGAVFGGGEEFDGSESVHDPDLLWAVRQFARRERHDQGEGLALAPRKAAWAVRAFRSLWPNVYPPSGSSIGDQNPWDAADFIRGMIGRLGGETTDEAIEALRALRDAERDSYSEHLRTVSREQREKRAEERCDPPAVKAITAALTDAPPETMEDLQAVLLDELDAAQKKIWGHPADWRRNFYDDYDDDKRPRNEEACRDELLKLLGDYPAGVQCAPEGHLAEEKRADIACTIGTLMLPIEVKGQWHPELWSAAVGQLDRWYTTDWRADGRGIYLVLWFGITTSPGRKPKAPPTGMPKPTSAEELKSALNAQLPEQLRKRIAVVVLDLTLLSRTNDGRVIHGHRALAFGHGK